jgi:hypothetical protein
MSERETVVEHPRAADLGVGRVPSVSRSAFTSTLPTCVLRRCSIGSLRPLKFNRGFNRVLKLNRVSIGYLKFNRGFNRILKIQPRFQ